MSASSAAEMVVMGEMADVLGTGSPADVQSTEDVDGAAGVPAPACWVDVVLGLTSENKRA